jgi:hypothetical protein
MAASAPGYGHHWKAENPGGLGSRRTWNGLRRARRSGAFLPRPWCPSGPAAARQRPTFSTSPPSAGSNGSWWPGAGLGHTTTAASWTRWSHVMGIHRQKIRKIAGTTIRITARSPRMRSTKTRRDEPAAAGRWSCSSRLRAKARLAGWCSPRQDPAEDGEERQARETESPRFRFREAAAQRSALWPATWTSPTSRTNR